MYNSQLAETPAEDPGQNPLTAASLNADRPRVILIDRVLEAAIAHKVSDVHMIVGRPPMFSINGRLKAAETKTIEPADMQSAVKSITEERAQVKLAETGSVDFAINFQNGRARFRANIATAQGQPYITLRRLPNELLTPEQIGVPKEVLEIVQAPRGLLLVTGPTGSGKTTTLASLINYIATNFDRKIITIEEPTEYRFNHGRGLVVQREVPNDVPTFQQGLIDALRQAPNVIMLGEMREIETMRVALTAAETGHLVLATLHTSSAAETVNRLVEQFPEGEREQIRMQLSMALKGVICQQLVPLADGRGRVCAMEFMRINSGIANHIRQGQAQKITSDIQIGKNEGMRLLDDELGRLYREGKIKYKDGWEKANDRKDFEKRYGKDAA